MRFSPRPLLLIALAAALTAADAVPAYEDGPASADGIGKRFLGREIAQVMGHEGADWLDRPEREDEERPSQAIVALRLRPTDVVADIGAGTGYISFLMAPRVARVLAVDIQPEMLDRLRATAAARGVANVEPVLGAIDDPKLPAGAVDLALFVDVYHELDHPIEVMGAVRRALKPDGRLVLIEYRGEDPAVPIKPLHKLTEAQARRELEALGFVWRESIEVLPRQHVFVFGR